MWAGLEDKAWCCGSCVCREVGQWTRGVEGDKAEVGWLTRI